MKLAAIADMHSNSAALEAVIADIRAHGIDDIVCLGDVASGPMEARKTIDRLIELGIATVRGNHDRYLVERMPEAMGLLDKLAYAELGSTQLDWLRSLPPTLIYRDDVFLCHGTPASDETYWTETALPDGNVCMAPLDRIAAAAEGVTQSLILCGHTHIPRALQLPNGSLLVNPGSAGYPGYRARTPHPHVVQNGTPDASYAILERVAGRWSVTFRLVPYDTRRMAELVRKNGLQEWVSVLETGWFQKSEC